MEDVRVCTEAKGPPSQSTKVTLEGRGNITICLKHLQKRDCPGSCSRAHVEPEELPLCRHFWTSGKCSLGSRCLSRHRHGPALRSPIVIQCNVASGFRVARRAQELLGKESAVEGASKQDNSKDSEMLIFVDPTPAKPERAMESLAGCPYLHHVIDRIYYVGQGPFENVGAAVDSLFRSALPETPRLVKVRATPAWAERQAVLRLRQIEDANDIEILESKESHFILDIVVARGEVHAALYSLGGLSATNGLPVIADPRRRLEQRVVSKASWKLEELLERANLSLPPDALAIDLGAAPGSWTMLLSERVRRVVAVDPASLGVDALPQNVHHVRARAEDAMEEVADSLGGEGADLLLCDANAKWEISCAMMARMARLLKPCSFLVWTVKHFGYSGEKGTTSAELAAKALRQQLGGAFAYEIWHLLANSQYERLVLARLLGHSVEKE